MDDLKSLQALSKDYSILYVEDNGALRKNADHLLHKFFHKVSVAKDGVDGLEKFKKDKYPIVITDIKMPNMDGVALAKHIKEIAPKTHIIVMSAFDDKEYLLEFIKLGVFRFLKKPVKLKDFTDILYETIIDIKDSIGETIPQAIDKESKKEVIKDENINDTDLLFSILHSLKEKKEKLEVHNYYKGLSITNNAELINIDKNSMLIKTTFLQEKAIQFEGKTTIASAFLPYVVECGKINIVSYEEQLVELEDLHFTKTSPIDRSTVRVYPEGIYSVSLYLHAQEIKGDIEIEDISLSAVRLSFDALPAGLKTSKEIRLEIDLEEGMELVRTPVKVFRIEETEEKFHVVFIFESDQKRVLMNYITKRQMAIIREFKGIQNK